MDFYNLDLDDRVFDALDAMHFEECTPVQEKTIPVILEGHDLIGVAQTGTGKTAAYLLPILSKLCGGGYPKDAINCIIMSPTRELAQQIDQALEGFSFFMPISSVAVYGGNDGARYEQEKRGLAMGADVIIATPGRLISHLSLGNVDFSKVSFFVLDEADRMLDMGFCDDIMQIEKFLPKKRQTIMFSATMPNKIQQLAKSILNEPVEVKIAVSKPAEKIAQSAYICREVQKIGIIKSLFQDSTPERVIIFSGSKSKVKDLTNSLKRKGYNADEMHSDLEQKQRDAVMYNFKTRKIDILVATDIVARGIDIDDIQMVINYDVPRDSEDYVHRIGRTARANKDGRAITLVGEKDQYLFSCIERFLNKEIDKNPVPQELGEVPSYKTVGQRSDSARGAKDKKKKPSSIGRGGRRSSSGENKQKTGDFEGKNKSNVVAKQTNAATSPDSGISKQGDPIKKKRRRNYKKPRNVEGKSENS